MVREVTQLRGGHGRTGPQTVVSRVPALSRQTLVSTGKWESKCWGGDPHPGAMVEGRSRWSQDSVLSGSGALSMAGLSLSVTI